MHHSRHVLQRAKSPTVLIAALSVVFTSLAMAKPPSPQHLWKNRCAECHGHPGEFASKYLTPTDELLKGRHHVKDLRRFMDNHYPPQGQVQAMHDFLRDMASTREPRYAESCSACHQDVEDFAKNSLELKDDGLVFAKSTNEELRTYLRKHQNLSRGDADFFNGVLTRSAWKVHRDEPEPDPNFAKKMEKAKKKKEEKPAKFTRDSWL